MLVSPTERYLMSRNNAIFFRNAPNFTRRKITRGKWKNVNENIYELLYGSGEGEGEGCFSLICCMYAVDQKACGKKELAHNKLACIKQRHLFLPLPFSQIGGVSVVQVHVCVCEHKAIFMFMYAYFGRRQSISSYTILSKLSMEYAWRFY